MTADMHERIAADALGWVIRLAEADFADWASFDAWLAADPAHAEVYWRLAEADRTVGELLESAPPAPQVIARVADIADHRRRSWRTPIIGWAVAASLVIGVGTYTFWPAQGDGLVVVESKPGMPRSIALADGTRIALNGSTKIGIDRRHPRTLRLDHGEARFDVVHYADQPFTVTVGDATVTDIGTRFNIVRDGSDTRIEVAEGVVRYGADATAHVLRAGQTLRASDGSADVVIGTVDPQDVAAWRSHRLVYDRAPLELVAADLARNIGVSIAVAPVLAGRSFTGTVSVDGTGEQILRDFASMTDLRVDRRDGGWLLTAPPKKPA